MNQLDQISKRRNEFRIEFASLFFNSYLNLFLLALIFAICLIYSATQFTWNGLSVTFIVLGFIYSDAVYYVAHRFQQHKKIRSQEWAFEMHSFWHHGMFSSQTMHIKYARDLNMVVLPFFIHGGILGCVYLPLAIVVEQFLGSELGWALLFAAAIHALWYEIVHTVSHQENPVFLKKLAEHHRAHHNPEFMGKCNFGIATTVFDNLFSTQKS